MIERDIVGISFMIDPANVRAEDVCKLASTHCVQLQGLVRWGVADSQYL